MRRVVLIGLIIVTLLALLLGGAVIYLNSSPGSNFILSRLNETLVEETKLSLGWEDAHGSFLYNLVIDNPSLITADGDTLVRARSLRARVLPWSLLEGGVELSRVEADEVLVDILVLGRGERRERRRSADRDSTAAARGGRGVRIRNVVIRDGAVQVGRKGVVRLISGIRLRGGLRAGGGAGVQMDVRRLRGRLDNWGLVIEDLKGELVLRKGLLWLLKTDVRTEGSRLHASGNLALSRRLDGSMRLALESGDLREWWPLIGDWAGEGPLKLEGWLRGRPWEPVFDLSAAGALAGIEFDSCDIEGRYMPDSLVVALSASGPGAGSIRASLGLDPRTGEGLLEADAAMVALEATPASIPVSADSISISMVTSSYRPFDTGGTLAFTAHGMNLSGLEADSAYVAFALGEGGISFLEPIRLAGRGYEIVAGKRDIYEATDVNLEMKTVSIHLTGSTSEPSALTDAFGLEMERGSIMLEADIFGSLTDPTLDVNAEIRDLERKGVAIGVSSLDFYVYRIFGDRIGNYQATLGDLRVESGFDLLGGSLDGTIQGDLVTLRSMTGYWAEGSADIQGEITIGADSIQARLDSGNLEQRELLVNNARGTFAFDPHNGAGRYTVTARVGEGRVNLNGRRDEEHKLYLDGQINRLDIGPLSRTFMGENGFIDGMVTSGSINSRIGKHIETLAARLAVGRPSIAGYGYERMDISAFYDLGTITIENITVTGEENEGGEVENAVCRGFMELPDTDVEGSDGRLDMALDISAVDLSAFQSHLGGTTLRGLLSATMGIGGTFREPTLDGLVELRNAQLDTFEISGADARMVYAGGDLMVERGRISSLGFTADFDGSLPFDISFLPLVLDVDPEADIQAFLHGEGDPTAFIQPVREQIERVGGNVLADITMSGNLNDPDLQGNVRWSDGSMKPAALGQSIEDIEMVLLLSGGKISVEECRGRMPSGIRRRKSILNLFGLLSRRDIGGDFTVTGNVDLGGGGSPGYNLNLSGYGLGVSDPTGSVAMLVDTELGLNTLEGNSYPRLDGTVQILQGNADVGMLLNMMGGAEARTHSDVEEKETFEADVEIEIPGRLRIVGGDFRQDVDVELQGNLILRKNPAGALYILGSLESALGRGHVSAYGYRWSIEEGSVTFGSIEEINPNLNARFRTTVQDVVILMNLTGTVREPVTTLSTEGDVLPESDILQLLTLGALGLGEQSGGIEERVSDFLEQAVSRNVRGISILGADEVAVEGLGVLRQGMVTDDLSVSVGKYYGNRIYAKYSHSLSATNIWSEIGVEYLFSRRFRLSGLRDRRGRYIFELKWRIDY